MMYLAAALIVFGMVLCVASSIGVVRMPDIFCRLHAGGIAQTLGPIALLAAFCLVDGGLGAATKGALAIVFLVLSSATGSHMIARAAYRTRLPMHPGTTRDEWEQRVGEGAVGDGDGRDGVRRVPFQA